MFRMNGMKIRLLSILLLSIVLLLPALRNGQPFMMSDTTTYVRGADAAIYKLTGMRTMWTGTFLERYEHSEPAAPSSSTDHQPPDAADLPVTINGRSVYYGLLLYLSCLFGNFWGAAIVQIMLTATAITLAAEQISRARGKAPPGPGSVLMMAIVIGLGPAGYFASYMMPDIFLPLAVIALCQLGLLWGVLTRKERGFWLAVLTAALLFHALHVVIIAAGFAALLLRYGRSPEADGRPRLIAILTTLLVALAGQAMFHLAVREATGAGPVDVPFLTARLTADGPGEGYLRAHCPATGLRLCNYLQRLPIDSDTFLWSHDPKIGIFSAAPPHDRRAIAAEQFAFVAAVATDRPTALARSTMISIGRQAAKWRLAEFNYGQRQRETFRAKLPAPIIGPTLASAAYRHDMPVQLAEIATPGLTLVALVAILLIARSQTERRAILCYLAFAIGALLLNAIICGAISTPHDRYQMRLIWILPFLAVALRPDLSMRSGRLIRSAAA
jgi:hypothetical protein